MRGRGSPRDGLRSAYPPPQLVVAPRSVVCVKIPPNDAFEVAASSRPETASSVVPVVKPGGRPAALPWGRARERGPVGAQALVLRYSREPGEW